MNITQEKIDELNSILKIEVSAEDYQTNVEKVLKENQKKMNMPGFRPGKVPFSLVKKIYGKAVLLDEINKIVVDSMYNYFGQNNIDILGNPLPNTEKSKEIDWEQQTDFDFYYDIALSPQFEMQPFENIDAKYYDIIVNEQVVDKYIYDIRKRFGKYTNPEITENEDLIYCEFIELDENNNIKENGLKNNSSVAIDLIKDKNIAKNFIGLKKDAFIDIDVFKTFENNRETSLILGIDETKLNEINPIFRMRVITISRVEPAEINIDLFQKIYKADNIQSEEQLRERIKQDAQISFFSESDKRFMNDIVDLLLEKNNIVLPDAFLKRWLLETNKEKLTKEQIEKEYKIYSDSLKWQLIENKIFKDFNINVSREDVKQYIIDYFRKILKPEANAEESTDFNEKRLNDAAENILNNKEEVKKFYDKLYDDRLKELLKNRLKIKNISVSYEEFVKLTNKKQKE